MKDFHDDLQRAADRIDTRIINDKEYTIKCEDPFGFWKITGTLPEELKGHYTGMADAWRAVQAYEDKRKLKESKVEKINDFIVTTDGKGGKAKRVKKSELLEAPVEA